MVLDVRLAPPRKGGNETSIMAGSTLILCALCAASDAAAMTCASNTSAPVSLVSLSRSGSRNYSSWRGFDPHDDADLLLSTSRARCAHRPDFRRRPRYGLPSDRVVPAGATGARLECQPGGAADACVGQTPPAHRWCGGHPRSSRVPPGHDAPTRDGWAGALLDGVARGGHGSHPNAPPAPNAGGASCIGTSRTPGRKRS